LGNLAHTASAPYSLLAAVNRSPAKLEQLLSRDESDEDVAPKFTHRGLRSNTRNLDCFANRSRRIHRQVKVTRLAQNATYQFPVENDIAAVGLNAVPLCCQGKTAYRFGEILERTTLARLAGMTSSFVKSLPDKKRKGD
jgi:hypothetical protein